MHQVVWAKCSVTNPETGEDVVLKKGDMLPDWVSDFTRFVLTSTGGVRIVTEPDPALLAALPEPVRLPEHPDPPAPPEPEVERPAANASRERWRAYALAVEAARGTPEADAQAAVEPLSRDELAERY